MDSLIVGNIKQRPTRSITSILGVALGVVLIVVTTGLARGILYDAGRRQSSVGAEIIFQPPGSFSPGVTTTPLTLPVAYCARLRQIKGVRAVTPVGHTIKSGAGGIGFEIVEGIVDRNSDASASFIDISGIRIVEGQLLSSDDDIIIDRHHAVSAGLQPGATVKLFNQTFRVAGIYEPESSARIKMRLSRMQLLLGAFNKCSSILVKCETPEMQEAVQKEIDRQLPGNRVILTRDIPSLYERGIPAFNVFLRIVIGLATVVSALVVLLAMYTAVMERTREIGILKSLGAPKGLIVRIIEQEALLISVLGVLAGFLISFLTGLVVTSYTSLLIKYELKWAFIAAAVGLIGGAVGAFYPAVRAANQDPVKALTYE